MLSVQDSKKNLQKTEWGLVIACHIRERADFKKHADIGQFPYIYQD